MLWVGTYAAKGGGGLHPVERPDGSLRVGEPEPGIVNASFGVWCDAVRTAYFVDEREDGRITAWRRDGGRWRTIGAVRTGGALPCYVSLSPDRRSLAVANYGDGSVALIGLDPETGQPGDVTDIVRHTGRGKDPERQEGPHAHCAVFTEDGRELYHVDLGQDRVFVYTITSGRIERQAIALVLPGGTGPRHIALHPDRQHALLLCELSGELLLLRRGSEGLCVIHALPGAPGGGGADNLGGHLSIAADGSILVTNRGHDSLAEFAISGDQLVGRGWRHTGGASPRHFHLDGAHAFVAHEESGSVSLLTRPSARGDADPGVTAPVPGAAFVIDIPEPNS